MFLLDREILNGILSITSNILKYYFFYDKEAMARFINIFIDYIEEEYFQFDCCCESDFRVELQVDSELRKHFTSYFISYHLHDILKDFLFFTEMELDCFENILPKYVGAKNDTKQGNKRAHY